MERYHVLQVIGEGSFGKVWKGRLRRTGQVVALKFIPKANKTFRDIEMLRKEIEILARIRHPHIISLLDSFETDTDTCLVTEHAQGDLFEVLEVDRTLPVDQIRSIAFQVSRALYYLHSHRIVHRDLKPQNVLICEHGRVKLCDFGFARRMSHDTLCLTSIKGTPLYMSPEVLAGRDYDARSDLWGLGVLIFELFAGVPPFLSDNLIGLSQQIANADVKWPLGLRGEHPELFSLLHGLLQKDPADRPTWDDLLAHPFLQHDDVVAELGYAAADDQPLDWYAAAKNAETGEMNFGRGQLFADLASPGADGNGKTGAKTAQSSRSKGGKKRPPGPGTALPGQAAAASTRSSDADGSAHPQSDAADADPSVRAGHADHEGPGLVSGDPRRREGSQRRRLGLVAGGDVAETPPSSASAASAYAKDNEALDTDAGFSSGSGGGGLSSSPVIRPQTPAARPQDGTQDHKETLRSTEVSGPNVATQQRDSATPLDTRGKPVHPSNQTEHAPSIVPDTKHPDLPPASSGRTPSLPHPREHPSEPGARTDARALRGDGVNQATADAAPTHQQYLARALSEAASALTPLGVKALELLSDPARVAHAAGDVHRAAFAVASDQPSVTRLISFFETSTAKSSSVTLVQLLRLACLLCGCLARPGPGKFPFDLLLVNEPLVIPATAEEEPDLASTLPTLVATLRNFSSPAGVAMTFLRVVRVLSERVSGLARGAAPADQARKERAVSQKLLGLEAISLCFYGLASLTAGVGQLLLPVLRPFLPGEAASAEPASYRSARRAPNAPAPRPNVAGGGMPRLEAATLASWAFSLASDVATVQMPSVFLVAFKALCDTLGEEALYEAHVQTDPASLGGHGGGASHGVDGERRSIPRPDTADSELDPEGDIFCDMTSGVCNVVSYRPVGCLPVPTPGRIGFATIDVRLAALEAALALYDLSSVHYPVALSHSTTVGTISLAAYPSVRSGALRAVAPFMLFSPPAPSSTAGPGAASSSSSSSVAALLTSLVEDSLFAFSALAAPSLVFLFPHLTPTFAGPLPISYADFSKKPSISTPKPAGAYIAELEETAPQAYTGSSPHLRKSTLACAAASASGSTGTLVPPASISAARLAATCADEPIHRDPVLPFWRGIACLSGAVAEASPQLARVATDTDDATEAVRSAALRLLMFSLMANPSLLLPALAAPDVITLLAARLPRASDPEERSLLAFLLAHLAQDPVARGILVAPEGGVVPMAEALLLGAEKKQAAASVSRSSAALLTVLLGGTLAHAQPGAITIPSGQNSGASAGASAAAYPTASAAAHAATCLTAAESASVDSAASEASREPSASPRIASAHAACAVLAQFSRPISDTLAACHNLIAMAIHTFYQPFTAPAADVPFGATDHVISLARALVKTTADAATITAQSSHSRMPPQSSPADGTSVADARLINSPAVRAAAAAAPTVVEAASRLVVPLAISAIHKAASFDVTSAASSTAPDWYRSVLLGPEALVDTLRLVLDCKQQLLTPRAMRKPDTAAMLKDGLFPAAVVVLNQGHLRRLGALAGPALLEKTVALAVQVLYTPYTAVLAELETSSLNGATGQSVPPGPSGPTETGSLRPLAETAEVFTTHLLRISLPGAFINAFTYASSRAAAVLLAFLSRCILAPAPFGPKWSNAAVKAGFLNFPLVHSLLDLQLDLSGALSSSCVLDELLALSGIARAGPDYIPPLLRAVHFRDLVLLLEASDPVLRARTCSFIGNLCRYDDAAYDALRRHDVIALLSRCLLDEEPAVRQFACFAIGNAAFHSGSLYSELRATIRPLVTLLIRSDVDRDAKTVSNAAGAIGNFLRSSEELLPELLAQGAVGALVDVLKVCPPGQVRQVVLFTLGSIAEHAAAKPKLRQEGISDIAGYIRDSCLGAEKKMLRRLEKAAGIRPGRRRDHDRRE
jgi:fused-like protein